MLGDNTQLPSVPSCSWWCEYLVQVTNHSPDRVTYNVQHYNPDCPGGWRLGDTQEAHLRHLDGEHEGERERGHDEDHGGQRDQDRAQPHAGVAACLTISTHAHTVDTER